jgi:hypothetical protein
MAEATLRLDFVQDGMLRMTGTRGFNREADPRRSLKYIWSDAAGVRAIHKARVGLD